MINVNIDLLLTERGEPGLLCDAHFPSVVAGVMFDAEARQVTIEFSDMDSKDLNIPVEEEYLQSLLYADSFHVGTIIDGVICSSRQVPVLFLNDPYGAKLEAPPKASESVLLFENFLKRCVSGQPLHREDLGNEATMNSVMSGTNTAVLQFAPQLARQRSMEAAPKAPTPQGPAGPSGPGGMGGSGGGAPRQSQQISPPPPRKADKDE